MLKLRFATRVGLIIILAMTLIWLVLIAYFFRHNSLDQLELQPPIARFLALAQALEQAPEAARGQILAAASSDIFIPRLSENPDQERSPEAFFPYPGELTSGLSSTLAPRLVSVFRKSSRYPTKLQLPVSLVGPPSAEVHIALLNGGSLVIEVRSRQALTRFGWPVGLGAGLLGTMIAVLALYVMYRETKPLAQLAAAVDQLDLSGHILPLPERSRSAPEIQALIRAYNRLQNRLSTLLQARMTMMGGISHDVRSFATRLRLRVELIESEFERERAIADIEDMIRLLDDALMASRAGAGELQQELLDLDELVRAEVRDRHQVDAPVTFHTNLGGKSAFILGDRLAVRRLLTNLIENAQKFGKNAAVSLAEHDDKLILHVDDDGPGIPENLRESILEPFIRLETSRNRATGGAGLGLAIAHNLAKALGGNLQISQAPSGGARLIVELPILEGTS